MTSKVKINLVEGSGVFPGAYSHQQVFTATKVWNTTDGSMYLPSLSGSSVFADFAAMVVPFPLSTFWYLGSAGTVQAINSDYWNDFNTAVAVYVPTVLTVVVKVVTLTYHPTLSWGIGVSPSALDDAIGSGMAVRTMDDLVARTHCKVFTCANMNESNVHVAAVQIFPAYDYPFRIYAPNYNTDGNGPNVALIFSGLNPNESVTIEVQATLGVEMVPKTTALHNLQPSLSREQYSKLRRQREGRMYIIRDHTEIQNPTKPWKNINIVAESVYDVFAHTLQENTAAEYDAFKMLKRRSKAFTKKQPANAPTFHGHAIDTWTTSSPTDLAKVEKVFAPGKFSIIK